MRLENKEIINRPLAEVYQLVRDDLAKLVPYMPNVEKIEVKKHAPKDANSIEVINHWYGKADVPGMLKKFIKPELFSWSDFAVWHNDRHCVEYRLESFLANDLFDAKGTNYFTAVGTDKTELRITCEIILYPEKVPGVPKLLARTVLPGVEAILEKVLGPNLTSLGKGLNEYFKNK
jgi:hypothetical protein